MSENISRGRKLLVVSDTTMQYSGNKLLAFEPVVRELDSISMLFDDIVWLGYNSPNKKTSVSAPLSSNIKMIPMPPSGSKGLLGKMKIIFYYPIYLFYILKNLKSVTHIHSRAPSHPAMIAMWLSKWMSKIICWHKYAGNWSEPSPSGSYAFQRDLLRSIHKPNVYGTINGSWPGQEKHLLSFENPCLFESELQEAFEIGNTKDFTGKLNLLFVGNLSAFKGIIQLVDALDLLDDAGRFEHLYIAGDGVLKEELLNRAKQQTKVKISVMGSLPRAELLKLYSIAHINILPSASEGFPKVIAEGAAYGCLPLVTDVSSIGQYIIDGKNGFLITDNKPETIAAALNNISKHTQLENLCKSVLALCPKFTYEYFNKRIQKHFLA